MAEKNDFSGKTEQELLDLILSIDVSQRYDALDVLLGRNVPADNDILVRIILQSDDQVIRNRAGDALLSQKAGNDQLLKLLHRCNDIDIQNRAIDTILKQKPDLDEIILMSSMYKDGSAQKNKILKAFRLSVGAGNDAPKKSVAKKEPRNKK